MFVYYILFIVLFISGLVLMKKPKIECYGNNEIIMNNYMSNKIYFLIILIAVGLVIGLRKFTVGTDTWNYVKYYYQDVVEYGVFGGKRENIEVGLRIIAWACSKFSDSYQLFLGVTGFLTSFLFAKYIYDNSKNMMISTIIFLGMFFVQSLNLMREWLAIGCILNAYSCLKRRKKVKFYLYFFFALISHVTSICFFMVPLLERIKDKRKALIITIISCIIFLILKNYILNVLILIFPKYNDYIFMDYFINESAFNVKDLIFAMILITYLYALNFKKQWFTISEYNQYYMYSILLVLSITFSLGGQNFYMLHRIVFYYSVFLITSLPNFIEKIKLKPLIYVVLIISMFYMLYRNSYNDNNIISNFYWFWE